MAQTHPPAIDPRNYKVNMFLLRRIWRLTRPYWMRREAWPSWIAMVVLVALAPTSSLLMVYSSFVLRDLTNVIVAHEVGAYWPMLWWFLVIGAVATFSSILMLQIDRRLDLHWGKWLTTFLVDHYLAKRTYYDIATAEDLDNPDQRLQASVSPFTAIISMLPRQLLSSLTTMVTSAAVLAIIDRRLMGAVIAYAAVQSIVTYFLYVPTLKQNFEIAVTEADLRYGILHVRDNAETVAFYRGEMAERTQILDRLRTAVIKNLISIRYQLKLMSVTAGFSIVWSAVPYFLLVPLFFSGKIEYGSIAQGAAAAGQVLRALEVFINFLPTVSAAAPHAVRLAEIQERFEAMDAERGDPSIARLTLRQGPEVRLDHVSLETPGGEQSLVQDLSLRLPLGDHLVIIGQTGVGKSSLLRAMAGLWHRGRGSIEMPAPDQCLFLPQRPYMILADLRSQLMYPHGREIGDESLRVILRQVCLPDLIEKHGGLDAVRDWGKVLSLGEQQRIAFARILVSRPSYVFLDEATSAVDLTTEARLYEMLAASGASFVSIGHRVSILDYHTHALRLSPGGTWKLGLVAEVRAEEVPVITGNREPDRAVG